MIKPSEHQAMRHLIVAATILISSPAFADRLRCITPPGSPDGTARWSSNGRIIEEYLITSDGNRYTCGPEISQNNSPRRVGNKRYYKQICGPLTIVKEETYRPCTFEERAGISSGWDLAFGLDGFHSSAMCTLNSNVSSDTRYELRDKNNQKFHLGTEYGFNRFDRSRSRLIGGSEPRDMCTNNAKKVFYTKNWRIGGKTISLTRVTEYQAESIKQPSL